ncbi:MAG: nucleotidyltransferase domain-containing protein [Clostridia bacterium]|nr:nucleotidyltransferase domain-containing protein [Clostridia bacterium]
MVFPVVVEGDPSLKFVFPTKQRAVQSAIDLARSDGRIRSLILFGSAVTMNCGMTSDIDLAVDAPDVSEEDFPKLAHAFYVNVDSEIDLIHYNYIRSELLKREIDQKGVRVYVKPG